MSYKIDNWTIARAPNEEFLYNGEQQITPEFQLIDVCRMSDYLKLKEQIEKMKNPYNCQVGDDSFDNPIDCKIVNEGCPCSRWRIKE